MCCVLIYFCKCISAMCVDPGFSPGVDVASIFGYIDKVKKWASSVLCCANPFSAIAGLSFGKYAPPRVFSPEIVIKMGFFLNPLWDNPWNCTSLQLCDILSFTAWLLAWSEPLLLIACTVNCLLWKSWVFRASALPKPHRKMGDKIWSDFYPIWFESC